MAEPGATDHADASELADGGLIVRISRRPHRAGRPDAAPAGGPRPELKRAAIAQAATVLFLRQGYQATSTEQIAAAAAVSKQTIYNQFGDKQTLFSEIVLGVTATAEAFALELSPALSDLDAAAQIRPALRAVARRYLAAVMNPQVLALRRLIISEAARFPALAHAYYDRAPRRVLAALADQLARLTGRGLLTVDEPARAAADFAFLLLGQPLDHGMFHVADSEPTTSELDRIADHAVDVFLAAYPTAGPASSP
jgi:TetR/AcrR family transcriptional regulator, mexJK operon transcriptional repressor